MANLTPLWLGFGRSPRYTVCPAVPTLQTLSSQPGMSPSQMPLHFYASSLQRGAQPLRPNPPLPSRAAVRCWGVLGGCCPLLGGAVATVRTGHILAFVGSPTHRLTVTHVISMGEGFLRFKSTIYNLHSNIYITFTVPLLGIVCRGGFIITKMNQRSL